ncbi:MAG: PAS domain S-box protein [Syntrophobacteraceae bacterium]|jgi:PAS domain S-box-containing protein
MQDEAKTKDQLIIELHELREQIAALEKKRAERKRAEETLQESEDRYRRLAESIPGIVFQYVLHKDGSFSLPYINDRIIQYAGISPEAAMAEPSLLFTPIHPDDREMIQQAIFISARTLRVLSEEHRLIDVNGQLRWFRVESMPQRLSNDDILWNGVSIDITERKQAEKALRESEKRYKQLLQSVTDYIYTVQVQDNRPLATVHGPGCAAVTGYTSEDYKADPYLWYRMVYDQDRDAVRDQAARVLSGEAASPLEHRIIHRDGSIRWVRNTPVPHHDEQGKLIAYDGMITNITERKQAEDALHNSKAYLAATIESIPFEFWVMGPDGCYTMQNHISRGRYGDAIGKRPEDICPNESILSIWQDNNRRAFAGEVVKGEVLFVFGNEERYFYNLVAPIHDRDRICGILGINVDITERKQTEESLLLSEERYSRLFADASLGIFRSTPGGQIINVNPAYARMHGFDSPEETKSLVNDVAKDLYADPSRRNEIVRMILDARGPIHTENLYKRKDGSIFTGNLHAWAVRDTEGKLLYLEGFVEDISERKRAEEEKAKLEAELRQAQKLEAIGTLAGGIAHDFNNILQPMMGYTEMALNELSPSSPLRDGLEQVLSASLRAKELIRQILTISRSAQEQQRILIDISLIIKEALKLLRSSLPTSVEIRQNIRMGVALADPTQIHQVLMNLCTNAAHAMDDNGILEVRLSHVDLSESDLADQSIVDLKPGPHLRLTVSDTGCGMDASTMEHIFDPYFTTKEVGKGSGLGLAVVSGIVKRHEGAITVRSEPDKGTTFTIYIPSVDVQSETAMQVDDVLQRGSERILLVDDEPAVMEMGTILLEHLGYNVTSQTDSVKALEVFRSSPDEFDLVITDYTMPKLRGLDFAMEVLRIRPDMPIVLCTGFSEKITPDSVKELGVELLLKPYGVRQISEMVRKILDAQKGA